MKGGDHKAINNYRPILKLSFLANILDALVSEQLESFLTRHNIVQPQQSGFRSGHSTVTATAMVINDIPNSFDCRQHCAALMLVDLSKAFDTVDHGLLKLSPKGLDNQSVSWF